MLQAQYRLELPRRLERRGPQRRPFLPSTPAGPYRLPHAVRDRLTTALQPYKNREAAFIATNRRAAAARGRQERARRSQTPDSARGPSMGSAGAPPKSPKNKSEA